MNDVKKVAKEKGVDAGRMKKADIIRSIQRAEGNDDCFGSGRAGTCGQDACLWRPDCLK